MSTSPIEQKKQLPVNAEILDCLDSVEHHFQIKDYETVFNEALKGLKLSIKSKPDCLDKFSKYLINAIIKINNDDTTFAEENINKHFIETTSKACKEWARLSNSKKELLYVNFTILNHSLGYWYNGKNLATLGLNIASISPRNKKVLTTLRDECNEKDLEEMGSFLPSDQDCDYKENDDYETKAGEDLFLNQSRSFTSLESYDLHFDEKKFLRVYPTVGDGSCGVHAILGKANQFGIYESSEASSIRQKFGEELIKLPIDQWPTTFRSILVDYVTNPLLPPLKIGGALHSYTQQYGALSSSFGTEQWKTETAKLVEIATNDPRARAEYAKSIQDTSHYLLQDELLEFAKFLGIRVALFQPGWGNDRDKLQVNIPDDCDERDPQNTVCVYYNGENHFSRAELIDIPPNRSQDDQKMQETPRI